SHVCNVDRGYTRPCERSISGFIIVKVAIIPARGGSKRIPRKNINTFAGKPMIQWSIEAAIESGCFDQVLVSTDDTEIAEISKLSGADVPFIRPAEFSDDHTPTSAVMRQALENLAGQGVEVKIACCIYATAPFVTANDISAGLEKFDSGKNDYVVSVTSYEFPIQRACRITPEGKLEMINPQNYLVRSQDLEDFYQDAGQFYWGVSSAWLKELPVFGDKTAPLIIPRHRVQDIDTQEDW